MGHAVERSTGDEAGGTGTAAWDEALHAAGLMAIVGVLAFVMVSRHVGETGETHSPSLP